MSAGTARPGLDQVRIVTPAPRDHWRTALAADPNAMPSQTPEWSDWLCATRGYTDASRLYEFAGGRRLVLPLVARTVGGVRVSEESMPYGFGYGGALVAGGQVSSAEAGTVLADLARRPVARVSLVPMPLGAAPWAEAAPPAAVRIPFLCHVLDLEGGFDRVWSQRYHRLARRSVQRARTQPLEVRRVTDGSSVDVFAQLNQLSVDRWAAQRGQPRWLARRVERRRDRVGQLATAPAALGGACVTWTAHLDGQPVAVYVTVRSGPAVHSWLSAMDRDLAGRTRAGALLQSLAIEEACAAGARWFHLGETEAGSGVEQFKLSFGAEPVRYEALRLERLPLTGVERRARALAARVLH